MPHTKRQPRPIHTTIGQLAAAYYDAALAEVGDETVAQRIASRMMMDAMRRSHSAKRART